MTTERISSPHSRPSGTPRLTVAIIVRDAEKLLPQTLATAASIADETIICDTGSTDCTPEIATRHGAKLVRHTWNNSFAAARNAAWDAASGDWILWLNAGETLDANSAGQLRRFVMEQASRDSAYMLLICVPPAANNISGEQIGQLRLVPNLPHLRFTGRVRESLNSSVTALGLATEGLPWPISRHASDNDPQLKQAKAQRDLRLLELDAQTHGQTNEILAAMGDCLATVGDAAGAVACYRKVLLASPIGSRPQRQAYYGLLSALDSDMQYRPQQLAICLEALERFPVDAQMLCAMGGYMQAQDRLDVAVRAYQTAFEYGQVDPELWHVPDIFDIAAACLANAQLLLGDDDAAQASLEQGIERNPNSQRLRRQLIELHIKHDRRQEALAQFDALPTDVPQREALRSAIRGACLAARENWTPALAYLQTAFRAGLRDVLCLRWLARTLHGLGDSAGLDEVLAAWQQSAPHSSELARLQAEIQAGSSATTSKTNAAESRRIDSAEVAANGAVPAPKFAKAGRINVYGPVE